MDARTAPVRDLANQSSGRPLTPEERALADALVRQFTAGEHDFDKVAQALEREKVARPSGATGPWSAAVLDEELRQVNAKLDEAYVEHGFGP